MSDTEEQQVVDAYAMGSKKKQRKAKYRARLIEYLNEYKNILIINVDNVGSKSMQNIRLALRGEAVILMGKNTIIRKVLTDEMVSKPQLEALLPFIRGNMGFCFTNGDLNRCREEIQKNKTPAAARSGAIGPIDYWIPAGPTGLDPGQTAFFQALNIGTKIARGAIEIINKVHLIVKGEKVSPSAVALLSKLNLKPFFFGVVVQTVYEDGAVYDASILDLTDEIMFQKWFVGVSHVAALSMELGMPNKASIGPSLRHGFKKMLAVATETAFTFPMGDKFLSGAAAAAAAAPAAAEEAAPEAAPESESESDSDGGFGGGLFD